MVRSRSWKGWTSPLIFFHINKIRFILLNLWMISYSGVSQSMVHGPPTLEWPKALSDLLTPGPSPDQWFWPSWYRNRNLYKEAQFERFFFFFFASTSSIHRSAWTVNYETRWTRKSKLGGWAVGQARPPQMLEPCLLLCQQLFAEALLSDSHVSPRETAFVLMVRECHCTWMWHTTREYLWARCQVSFL